MVQDGKTVYVNDHRYIYSGRPLKVSPCMPAKQIYIYIYIYFYTVVHEYIYNIMAACCTMINIINGLIVHSCGPALSMYIL